jgi:hypothetical protein
MGHRGLAAVADGNLWSALRTGGSETPEKEEEDSSGERQPDNADDADDADASSAVSYTHLTLPTM